MHVRNDWSVSLQSTTLPGSTMTSNYDHHSYFCYHLIRCFPTCCFVRISYPSGLIILSTFGHPSTIPTAQPLALFLSLFYRLLSSELNNAPVNIATTAINSSWLCNSIFFSFVFLLYIFLPSIFPLSVFFFPFRLFFSSCSVFYLFLFLTA